MRDILNLIFSYLIEFIKLFIVAYAILRLALYTKRLLLLYLPVSAALLVILNIFTPIDNNSTWYALCAMLIVCCALVKKKNSFMVILSYMAVTLLDMTFATVVMYVSDKTTVDLVSSYGLGLLVNSLSIPVLILMIPLCSKYTLSDDTPKPSILEQILCLAGELAFALYISSIQLFIFDEDFDSENGWTAIGVNLCGLIFIVVCFLLYISHDKNKHLAMDAALSNRLVAFQEEYFKQIMDREEKTRSFRHDIKNHIYVMNILYSKNEIGKLGDYLSSLNEDLKELSPSIVTGHPLVDVIIGDVLCHHENVHFTSTGQLPDELSLSSKDICTIFYNLLNNACEAAENTKIREVSLYVLIRHKNLHMRIVNSIDEKPIINHGVIATSKSNDFHGYGLPNARSCIKKNNGMLNVYCNDDSFVTDITLFSAL